MHLPQWLLYSSYQTGDNHGRDLLVGIYYSLQYFNKIASQGTKKRKKKKVNVANIIFYMIPSWLTLELNLMEINNCGLFWICVRKPVNGRKRCEHGGGFFWDCVRVLQVLGR
jgi:hypothetical protein